MTIEQTLGDILDQTVEAFSHASFFGTTNGCDRCLEREL